MHRKLESWAQQYTVLLSSGLEEQRRRFEARLVELHAAYAPPAAVAAEGGGGEGKGGGGGKKKKGAGAGPTAGAGAARVALTGEQVCRVGFGGADVCVCIWGWHTCVLDLTDRFEPLALHEPTGGGGAEAGAAPAGAPLPGGARAAQEGGWVDLLVMVTAQVGRGSSRVCALKNRCGSQRHICLCTRPYTHTPKQ